MKLTFVIFAIKLLLTEVTTQTCHIPGECVAGFFLGGEVKASYSECLDACKSYENCQWISYYEIPQDCVYYVDCQSISSDGCIDCFTGEATCPSVVCGQPGICQGNLVGQEKANSEQECQDICFTNEQCQWYTYYQTSSDCILTSDCLPYVTSTSVYGEKKCFIEVSSFSNYMVGGGFPASNGILEFGDLNNEFAVCEYISSYPISDNDAGVGTFLKERGFICGGYEGNGVSNKCYSWNVAVSNKCVYH